MENQEFENGEELLKTKQREREIRKGQKKQSFMKSLMRFLTCVGIVAGIYYFSIMPGWYLSPDAFVKSDPSIIQIINNKITKTPKIQNILKDLKVPNVPIFLAPLNELKEKLLALPSIEEVYVRRYAFPARVLIIVREATPIISISPDAKVKPVAAFTKNAQLITGNDYLPLPDEYKTILVLSYGNKGDDYTKWDLAKIKEIEKIAKYVETFSRESVEYIDLRNPKDIYVKVETAPIRLGQIDSGLYDRIRRIPSILPQVKQVKGKVKYIDLSWEKVNYLKME